MTSIYMPNGYFGDHGVMPLRRSWKADKPCDFHAPDIGTHADLCGRCGWKRHEHAPGYAESYDDKQEAAVKTTCDQ